MCLSCGKRVCADELKTPDRHVEVEEGIRRKDVEFGLQPFERLRKTLAQPFDLYTALLRHFVENLHRAPPIHRIQVARTTLGSGRHVRVG